MGNNFIDDIHDFIIALNLDKVEYILVRGYLVILPGYSRNTGGPDIWVNKTFRNYQRFQKAFHLFGLPVFDMIVNNFLNNSSKNMFSYGHPPVNIDIMTEVKGLKFKEIFKDAQISQIENLPIRLISFNHLIKAKKSSGRSKDPDDMENLGKEK